MIDDESHDYLYLILEYANMGQIATWNAKLGRYERSDTIFNFVTEHLKIHNGIEDRPQSSAQVIVSGKKAKIVRTLPPVEVVAQYLFR